MKLYSIVFVVFVSSLSYGSRWIIQNPAPLCLKSVRGQAQLQVLNEIKLLRHQYLFVEGKLEQNQERTTLSRACPGTKILADFTVPMVRPKMTAELPKDAWHVKALNYADVSKTPQGKGVLVAVIDTGIDLNHPAFKGKIWTNAKEIPGNGIDEDKNGFIDDVHGFNFVENTANVADDQGHGTHCSGLVLANPRDNSPFSAQGIAPLAKVLPVKIFKGLSGASFINIVSAIKYAADQGANVLSNSWGFQKKWGQATEDHMNLMKETIQYAGRKGGIFVVAAGNNGNNLNNLEKSDGMFFPVGFKDLDNLVGVAASNEGGTRAGFSNYGNTFVHIASPGNQILSTNRDGKWSVMSGTSMATPIISGVLAVGLSKGMRLKEIINQLIASADKTTHWESAVKSQGVVNLKKFLGTRARDIY